MAQSYIDSPSGADPADSSFQQANRDVPPNELELRYRDAVDQDVVPTVDISLALHNQLYPHVTLGWMDQYELSAQLISSRKAVVLSPRSRHSLSVLFEKLSPSKVFGDMPADPPSGRRAEELCEEVAA